MTTLGISIGTHRTGICVLKGETILVRRIRNYPSPWSEKKLEKILKGYRHYLHKYQVNAVVVKVPTYRHRTPAVNRIVSGIERLAKEYYCDFDLITRTELKGHTLMRTTDELIEYTRRLYPDFNALHEKGKSTRHNYYKKLYEAVLSAHIYRIKRQMREPSRDETKE